MEKVEGLMTDTGPDQNDSSGFLDNFDPCQPFVKSRTASDLPETVFIRNHRESPLMIRLFSSIII